MYAFRSPLPIVFGVVLVIFVALVTKTVVDYGGMDGLWQRAQLELRSRVAQPHPEFVPTPLPVADAATPRDPLVEIVPSPAPAQSGASPPQPVSQRALPEAVELTGFSHQWQTWNNCGPATLAMNMSYYGSSLDQAAVGAVLRRHPDDKNVNLAELAQFARSQGFGADLHVNGTSETLKLLLSKGIPVLIETWLEEEPNDGLGHYRLLTGYDDRRQQWIAYDSYVSSNLINPDEQARYAGIHLPYAETDALWHVFHRSYLLIYPQQKRPVVESIVGPYALEPMWRQALQSARTAVHESPEDPFAWFNLGTSLTALGSYAEAATAFDRARQIGLPWRMLWYQFGPFEAYHNVGRDSEVVALADATLTTTQNVEELHYWRGVGLMALGDPAAARQAWRTALELNPDFAVASEALASGG